jgi:hypothetical protein
MAISKKQLQDHGVSEFNRGYEAGYAWAHKQIAETQAKQAQGTLRQQQESAKVQLTSAVARCLESVARCMDEGLTK